MWPTHSEDASTGLSRVTGPRHAGERSLTDQYGRTIAALSRERRTVAVGDRVLTYGVERGGGRWRVVLRAADGTEVARAHSSWTFLDGYAIAIADGARYRLRQHSVSGDWHLRCARRCVAKFDPPARHVEIDDLAPPPPDFAIAIAAALAGIAIDALMSVPGAAQANYPIV